MQNLSSQIIKRKVYDLETYTMLVEYTEKACKKAGVRYQPQPKEYYPCQ